MREEKMLSALLGLIGACSNNPKTAATDALVVRALALPRLGCSDAALQDLTAGIYAEKNLVAPGCAVCTMPCGNTSDYDMARLYGAEAAVRQAKLQLLESLQALAVLCHPWGYGASPKDGAAREGEAPSACGTVTEGAAPAACGGASPEEVPPPIDCDIFYRGLSYFSYDLPAADLLAAAAEADALAAAIQKEEKA